MAHVQLKQKISISQSRLHSTVSRRVWNISREGDSTASLGSLGQGSITFRGKKFLSSMEVSGDQGHCNPCHRHSPCSNASGQGSFYCCFYP